MDSPSEEGVTNTTPSPEGVRERSDRGGGLWRVAGVGYQNHPLGFPL